MAAAFELGFDELDLNEPHVGQGVWAHLFKADYEFLIMNDQTEAMP